MLLGRLVHLDLTVRMVLKDFLGSGDQKERLDKLVLLEVPVHKAHLESRGRGELLVKRVQLEPRELQEMLAHRVILVSEENKVTLEYLEIKDQLVYLDLQDRRVQEV